MDTISVDIVIKWLQSGANIQSAESLIVIAGAMRWGVIPAVKETVKKYYNAELSGLPLLSIVGIISAIVTVLISILGETAFTAKQVILFAIQVTLMSVGIHSTSKTIQTNQETKKQDGNDV